MTPHFLKWSFGPKIESVDGICRQTDSMNIFYLDVKTGPNRSNGSKRNLLVVSIMDLQVMYVNT